MINRYEKKEISALWTEEAKFQTYLDVELAILEAMEGELVPAGTAKKIRDKAIINPERISEIEAVTKHDVIAFCTSITENLDPEVSRFFHYGVTSSDIIDSSMTLMIRNSLDRILPEYHKLLVTLFDLCQRHRTTLAMGRSHGMYAEPLSLGQKLLGHYHEFRRRYLELKQFRENELTIQFSGAVGNYTILTPALEEKAAKVLGLKVEPLSTQVIPRDRLAKLISLNALTASAIERIAVEIRHLHRSEVDELHEGFAKGQKGSSIMPHKKNPIAGENLTGMARFLRSHLSMALENIVLWHERDISHSSTERLYLPDHFGILFYSLERLNKTLENLDFHTELIEARVASTSVYLSSYYLHHLIKETLFTREEIYALVQQAAFDSKDSGKAQDFHLALEKALSPKGVPLNLPVPTFDEIKKIYLKHVDTIFNRAVAP
jgi:adenylosuccinate lyase